MGDSAPPPEIRAVCAGRYLLKRKLGSGSFGDIYKGVDTRTGERVAVKVESPRIRTSQLAQEAKLYQLFASCISIPKFHWFGNQSGYNALVISLLDQSLDSIVSQYHNPLSLKTVLMLADQMISALEFVHSNNFIHGDVKPENFMIGLDRFSTQIFLIDFGLSKKYRDVKSHEHLRMTTENDLNGTARYASISTLRGIEPSRRDDMESLGYVLIWLLKGTLPWIGVQGKNRREKYKNILDLKVGTRLEELCSGLPDEFVQYFHAVRRLKYVDEPEYSRYRAMFRSLFLNLGFVYDYAYDWIGHIETATEDIEEEVIEPIVPVPPNTVRAHPTVIGSSLEFPVVKRSRVAPTSSSSGVFWSGKPPPRGGRKGKVTNGVPGSPRLAAVKH
jgi:serine/threonine protein kinase